MTPSYALVFKTHAWDEFISRQFARYVERTRSGTLAVVVDETNSRAGPIDHGLVFRTNTQEMLALGLADTFGKGSLLWWNTDYPNYLAFQRLPEHDYYIFAEYDTCANLDLDDLVRSVASRNIDLLTQPTRQPKNQWYWTRFHEAVYPREEIRGSLNCFSIFSRRAMQMLLDRRIEASQAYKRGQLKFWPGNEVFIATEIHRAGYNLAALDEFGDASSYEWHPPILEDDLPNHQEEFLHPVLDRQRYIASVLKFEFDLSSYFFSGSALRRTLSRFPARDYVRHMPAAFRRQVMVKLRQTFGAI